MLQPSWLRRRISPPRTGWRGPPCLEMLEERCLLTTLVGLTTANKLVYFDSSTPNTLNTIGTVTGIAAGQSLVAIDFDSATGTQYGNLYGLGVDTVGGAGSVVGQIYQINPLTAVASAIGPMTPFATHLAGTEFGLSIDPTSGNIRIIDNAGENLVVSSATGALLNTETNISPSSDSITAVAYGSNFPGATLTTLYGYDAANDKLVTVGSTDGVPISPNMGIVTVIGPSGVHNSNAGADLGFTIDANGNAYLNIEGGAGVSSLYTANLTTGAALLVNNFPVGITMEDISVAPAVTLNVADFPGWRTIGLADNFAVTAETVYGTTATGYNGVVKFSSSDAEAVFQPSITALVNGTYTASVTLNTLGVQSITATDTVSGITGSQTGITVQPNSELVGLTTGNQLVRFFAAMPGQVTPIGTITGLASGQTMVAIAFRPATGGLYGIGYGADAGQLYQINPTTAVATAVGTPFSFAISGVDFGFSFDPVQDLARVTTNDNENFLINPNTGSATQETSLTPSSSNVVGLAYNDNVAGAATTTLYGYDLSDDNLVVVGSVGSDTSSNGGVVTPVGPSGVTSTPGAASETGFAIDANGAAYLNLDVGNSSTSTSGLYTVNPSTGGGVAFNGAFESGFTMRDIAVAQATGFTLGNLGATKVAGANSPVTVTAVDPYGNTALGYEGTVKFSSSDIAAALPASTSLTYGVGTANVTFNTVGAQSFTATDTAVPNVTTSVGNINVVAPVDFVGLMPGNELVRFSSATPDSFSILGTVSGLTSGQTLVGIAFSPTNDQLYGLGVSSGVGQLYTIDPNTAIATALPSSFPLLSTDTSFSFGFDPVADDVRVITNGNENLRLNPTTGALVSSDGTLSPSSTYAGVAYSNYFNGATSTTLYSYDVSNNDLVTIGSVNGSPNPASTGQVNTVGSSGVTVSAGTAADLGFTVGGDGVGYLNLVSGGSSGLYTANLGTGVLSLVGTFGTGVTLLGVAEAPTASFFVSGYPSAVTTGTPNTFTVTAVDAFDEAVPSYRGTVTFTSSDPLATLPANSTLTNGTGTFTATFATNGTQSLTASDLAAPTINGSQLGGIVVTGGTTSPLAAVAALATVTAGAAAPVASLVSKLGVVQAPPDNRTAQVVLNTTGTGTYTSADTAFNLGVSTDTFVVGDWNDIGYESLGVVQTTSSGVREWSLDSNGDNTIDTGDAVEFYGLNTDTPVVGDWTGTGTTKIGVARQTTSGVLEWVLNTTGSGAYSASDAVDYYGLNTDTPVVGDWTGSGKSEIGVVRETSSGVLEWVLNTSGTGSYNSADTVYYFGSNGDIPVVGDWTGDGKDQIGVVVPQANGTALWVLDTSGTGVYTPSDPAYSYGQSTNRFIVGAWNTAALYSGDGVLNAQVQPLVANATFHSLVNQAIGAWQQAGLNAQDTALLTNANYSVGTLGNGLLAETTGNNVVIDATAQGNGWSESATPQSGKMDLLTTLEHEMGHLLGLPDQSSQPSDLMYDSLLPGVSKAPSTQDIDAVFASMGQ